MPNERYLLDLNIFDKLADDEATFEYIYGHRIPRSSLIDASSYRVPEGVLFISYWREYVIGLATDSPTTARKTASASAPGFPLGAVMGRRSNAVSTAGMDSSSRTEVVLGYEGYPRSSTKHGTWSTGWAGSQRSLTRVDSDR